MYISIFSLYFSDFKKEQTPFWKNFDASFFSPLASTLSNLKPENNRKYDISHNLLTNN